MKHWRTTGICRADGDIKRDGETTHVLVCIHKADSTFYYDSINQELFDSVDYPITLEEELKFVWIWDTKSEKFVYQEVES